MPKASLLEKKKTSPIQTDFAGFEPQEKLTEKEAAGSRVVVVSPYSQINVFLEAKIPELLRDAVVEFVSDADINQPPYLRVQEREQDKQRPYVAIDFGRVIAMVADIEKVSTLKSDRLLDLYDAYGKILRAGALPPIEGRESDELETAIQKILPPFVKGVEEFLRRNLHAAWRIPVPKVRRTVDCFEYRNWCREQKINRPKCLIPTDYFSRLIKKQEKYDGEGNFIPISVYINNIVKDLASELARFFSEGCTKQGYLLESY